MLVSCDGWVRASALLLHRYLGCTSPITCVSPRWFFVGGSVVDLAANLSWVVRRAQFLPSASFLKRWVRANRRWREGRHGWVWSGERDAGVNILGVYSLCGNQSVPFQTKQPNTGMCLRCGTDPLHFISCLNQTHPISTNRKGGIYKFILVSQNCSVLDVNYQPEGSSMMPIYILTVHQNDVRGLYWKTVSCNL